MYKPTRYSEIDSVGNDFLAIHDAFNSMEKVNPMDYSCIYGQWLVEYDDEGKTYITQLGPNRNAMPTDDPYWDDRTAIFDASGCFGDETELYHFFRTEIKPLLIR